MTKKPAKSCRQVDGVVLLNKALYQSSNHALQEVKRLFEAEKAGHTGSLDPLATGMLMICFGQANKYAKYLIDAPKSYQATALLGKKTTTGDAEGEIVEEKAVPVLSENEILALLERFVGKQIQVPSMYSALKYQGKPLYFYARKGIEVPRKQREIEIYSLTLDSFTEDSITFSVHCSKGTYIRSLVEDIGNALGCGAYVSMLHRTGVAGCKADQMKTYAAFGEIKSNGISGLDACLLPIDAVLGGLPEVTLTQAEAKAVCKGQKIVVSDFQTKDVVKIYDDNALFLGIGELEAGLLSPRRLMQYGL